MEKSKCIDKIIEKREVDALISVINQLRNENANLGFDLDCDQAILDGYWPSAEEQLTIALEKARSIKKKE